MISYSVVKIKRGGELLLEFADSEYRFSARATDALDRSSSVLELDLLWTLDLPVLLLLVDAVASDHGFFLAYTG